MQRYALVTGSSSGLGEAVIRFLLDLDYVVFGISRRGADFQDDRYIDLIADLRSEADVSEVMEFVQEETEGLDLVVHAAGVFALQNIDQMKGEDFLDILQTNISGAFHLTKYLPPFLIEDETHIVTVSSVAALKGFAGNSAYCASKAGLRGLLDSCKEEWKNNGVRFSTIYSGAIATPLWDNVPVDIPRDFFLDIEDFLHVFQMVVTAPSHIQFPEIHLMHKNGVME